MLTFLIRRLLQMIPTILAVVVLIFVLFSIIPGTFVSSLGDDGRGLDPAVYERMLKELGLNDPVHVRLGRYVGGLLTGFAVRRARSTGRTTSPTRSGRIMLQRKPIEVADKSGGSGMSPTGRNNRRQRWQRTTML